ncbi:threonine/serine exporter family protein [Metallibacterium sp.]|uniref:threonine/serine ThrE exporter family protein n=1 Tax=Metallibacterium sp. TaxID=2940281 RepID=UPI0026175E9F|nr:threonine/serine exporter family protein [Metallibacterium sp.]
MSASGASFNARVAFVVETARRLHQYGTAAPRLEMAVSRVGERLGLRIEVWSSPTAIILSASAQGTAGATPLAEVTQVMRLPPGDVNLARLCKVDRIADEVIAGTLDIEDGFRQLQSLTMPPPRWWWPASVTAFGIAAAMVAVLLRGSWPDLLAAGLIGVVIGQVTVSSASRPRLAVASEAIAAVLATLIAGAISAFIVPLAIKTVVISGLIVLMPGLALTNAVREISTQHLVSGTARLAGALSSLLKLTFGTLAGAQILDVLGWHTLGAPLAAVPDWVEIPALLLGTAAFGVLFQAAPRDWPLVMGAAIIGYLSTRMGTGFYGPSFGVFVGGLIIAALSNLYARYRHRPGALVREPGIILLVPGAVGFRSVSSLLEHDVHIGTNAALLLISLLVALVAGLLFGDLLIGPRRSL